MIFPTAKVNTAQFGRAITALSNETGRNEYDFITDRSKRVLRPLAFNTPRAPTSDKTSSGRTKRIRRRGRARAGWWPAWKRLGVNGTPYVGNYNMAKATEGEFIDGRKRLGSRFFTMVNTVSYIEKLDSEEGIMSKSLSGQMADMMRHLERQLKRSLRKYSG